MDSQASFAGYAHQRVTKPEHVLERVLNDEAVFLNMQNAQYYGLDDVGTRMYTVLTTSDTVQTAFETILPENRVDAETLQHDIAHLIEELVAHGLLVLHEK